MPPTPEPEPPELPPQPELQDINPYAAKATPGAPASRRDPPGPVAVILAGLLGLATGGMAFFGTCLGLALSDLAPLANDAGFPMVIFASGATGLAVFVMTVWVVISIARGR